ncbi:MAG: peptidoglycan bridge formation glycyltransferase FemA/FemB family protein [Candidatus Peregrinibacteria bacterium]|nr:peptidoglycan bridge formation glycyltransferase FemA/FemB family protein [Candidatus Peregrinibacteria bacterium]MCB9807985.1 peptidoglycan bridge formation glycyltransferase FemA/FemB family protein [Candidatus Peribacteria bacterium]
MVTLLNATDANRDQWSAICNSIPLLPVNQTWEWGEAMRTFSGVQPIRLLAMRDGQPVGILQAFEWKIGPISLAITSGESGDGGGPVVLGDDKSIALKLIEALYAESFKRRTLRTTIYGSPVFGEAMTDVEGFTMATKWTPIVELLSSVDDMLAQRIEQKARNQISKSEKNGVTVFEGTRNDLAAYRLIQASLVSKKHLNATHLNTLESLEHLWDALAPSKMIKLWLAKKGEGIVGGALILYSGKQLLYRSGVLTLEGRDLYAGNAIQWAIIRDAIENGYTSYNMCGGTVDESDPLFGITKFKLSFGGEMKPFRRYSASGNRVLKFLVYRLRRIFGKNEWFPLLIYP